LLLGITIGRVDARSVQHSLNEDEPRRTEQRDHKISAVGEAAR
jgi:hypothetical protein